MVRKLQMLALAVGAVLAVGGVISSAASGSAFTAEQSPVTIEGVAGSYLIEATGLAVECEIAKFHGEIEGTSAEQISLTPVITGCTAFGFINGKVTGFGHYEGEEQACELVVRASSTGDLVCEEGAEVTFEAGTCTVHLPAQSGLGGISFTNVEHEEVGALEVGINLTEIQGSHTDGFLCPFSGSSEFSGTSALGEGLVTGQDPSSGEPVGIAWDE